MDYKPPFTVSSKAINLIAEISAQVERYAIQLEQKNGLLLRKINRIKTIQGSLAIEGNSLSESIITDIIDGKNVVAPIREIQEVKNAIRTYDAYPSLNPFSVKDLLKAHNLMMETLLDDAGRFRSSGVGVFSGNLAIHVAPPPLRVPILIDDLFDWLKNSDDHLLIKSCVFHYEFEFIHPFSDGNGRIGRLWQSLILGKLHPIFEYLPVENMVFANQQGYYDAINKSTKATDSGIFINFMLNEILETLKQRQDDQTVNGTVNGTVNDTVNGTVNNTVNNTVKLIIENPYITFNQIAFKLNKSRGTIARMMKKLQSEGFIIRVGSDKSGYWKVLK
jgi:Fic family protein